MEDEEENNGLKKEKEETTGMEMVVTEKEEGRMRRSRTKRIGKMKKSQPSP